MGVKTVLTHKDLEPFLHVTKLDKTQSGITDTVYIADDTYIVKIFEKAGAARVQAEIDLLRHCRHLNVAKVIKHCIIRQKQALIFQKCPGHVVTEVKNTHIKQIGRFLKALHQKTQGMHSSNAAVFDRQHVESVIYQTEKSEFIQAFKKLTITPGRDGIIHGDLFVDNAVFEDDRLGCVYDFTQSCSGDFLFDLAVAALSWCQNRTQVQTLLRAYKTDITADMFAQYVAYARLFYTAKRFLNKRDYTDLWRKNDTNDNGNG